MASSKKIASGGDTGVMIDEPTKAERFGRGMIAIVFVAGGIFGAALGTGLASYILESEFTYQRSLREYLEETNTAYSYTNEALEKASTRLRAEVEKYQSAQLRLSQVEEMLKGTRNAIAESVKELKASNDERDLVKDRLQHFRSAFDATERELERTNWMRLKKSWTAEILKERNVMRSIETW
ncbi:hypothetical protein ACHAXA_008737 [Cyclostephanos tholiformis]|uniref:Uncharacterized protein n=1 Tax=Cyclostephanos tholiformis TaxID=382380 RepID=A0ABD3RD08_9STRA